MSAVPPLGGPLDPTDPSAAAPGGAPGEGEGAGAEIVDDAGPLPAGGEPGETVEHPARVMRIASMIKQLLEEVRHAPLDEAGRATLREIYHTSVQELAGSLSADLRDELARVTLPFADRDAPTEPELRIAQAQLVGWLDGLFHGIQATVFAQQMAARAQLEDARQRGLPPGGDERMQRARPPGYL
ncbi:MAG: proteasome activator [Acidimicrobiales bacterium]